MQNCLWFGGCRNLNRQERIPPSSVGGAEAGGALEPPQSPPGRAGSTWCGPVGSGRERKALLTPATCWGAGVPGRPLAEVPHPTPTGFSGLPGLITL